MTTPPPPPRRCIWCEGDPVPCSTCFPQEDGLTPIRLVASAPKLVPPPKSGESPEMRKQRVAEERAKENAALIAHWGLRRNKKPKK